MIRTFEELFDRMRADRHNPHSLMAMYEEHRYWKKMSEKNSGTAELSAFVHMNKYRDNLLGYLSCLQDTAYICQSEYDQL